ncbi:unnamed protein product [Parnassius apollo]|uniref:(apollo) hypothetical protein n=1 Tax=Parnassius apollo TaxID=110799 RepID=A0A8S3XBY4_PARAO|nr:unnamed protein product [Parnassius apollo]
MVRYSNEEWIRSEQEQQERQELIEKWSTEKSEEDDVSLLNDDNVADELFAEDDDEADPFLPQIPSYWDSDYDREFLLGKDGETIWLKTPMGKTSRTPARNIITHLTCAKGEARICNTALYFSNYFLVKTSFRLWCSTLMKKSAEEWQITRVQRDSLDPLIP